MRQPRLEALPQVKFIFEGKHGEADQLQMGPFYRYCGMPYQTAECYLEIPGHDKYENYYRELDLNRAVTTTHS